MTTTTGRRRPPRSRRRSTLPRRRRLARGGGEARPRRVAVPRAVSAALRRLRAPPDRARGVDQPAQLGLHAAGQAVGGHPELPRPVHARLGDVRPLLERDAGHRHLHAVQRATADRRTARRGTGDEPEVPGAQPVPCGVLRALRARCGGGGRALALPARCQHRRGQRLSGQARAARRHHVAQLVAGGLDRHGRWSPCGGPSASTP